MGSKPWGMPVFGRCQPAKRIFLNHLPSVAKTLRIVFTGRRMGDSKMSTVTSLDAAWRVLRLAAVFLTTDIRSNTCTTDAVDMMALNDIMPSW